MYKDLVEGTGFVGLYDYFDHTKFIGSFVDIDRQLIMLQPLYSENWSIFPNTNKAEVLNDFYTKYPKGIHGTIKLCLEMIKDYVKPS